MRGMTMGDLIIGRDGEVTGVVMGDVVVEAGAEAIVRGMVGGAVIERGGRAVVHGMVGG